MGSWPRTKETLTLFLSYASQDEVLCQELEKHLRLFERQGLTTLWHHRHLTAGTDWQHAIDTHLEEADVILLLVSPDFLASDYCYGVEIQRALQRHTTQHARVVPLLLRPAIWEGAPFAHLAMLPANQLPITKWADRDEALVEVAQGIHLVITDLLATRGRSARLSAGPSSAELREEPANVTTLPFLRNPFFTGREPILTQLRTLLASSQQAALTQPPALTGLGGVGKTQTALEYAYRYHQEYHWLWWVRAQSREDLLADITRIADHLHLPEKTSSDQQLTLVAVRRWLEMHTGWLLILDNADDLTLVRDILPRGQTGHVLLTTRSSIMAGLARKVELDTLPPDEGVLLVLRRAGLLASDASLEQVSPDERRMTQELVREMGSLPLALDQAGAYLEETACGLATYLALYREKRAHLLQRRGGLLTEDHPEPVAMTCLVE